MRTRANEKEWKKGAKKGGTWESEEKERQAGKKGDTDRSGAIAAVVRTTSKTKNENVEERVEGRA